SLRVFLCILGGVLLGVSYPPFETGMFAAAGFVPLLILLSEADSWGRVFRISYGTFFIFNLITLYWPGGFVHGKDGYLMISGGLLLLAHPLFLTVPMLVRHSVRKSIGEFKSALLFPFIWVAFEYVHAGTQLSFPWLTLGNTQTYELAAIQVASVIGVYGISFWLASLNVLLYLFFAFTAARPQGFLGRRAGTVIFCAVLLYAAPFAASQWLQANEGGGSGERMVAAIIQPDIDPFEKWGADVSGQIRTLREVTDSTLGARKPDIVVWPETAIPFYLLSPAYHEEYRSLRKYVADIGVPLLTGIPDIVMYKDPAAAPRGSRALPDGTRYETFNSSILLLPGSDTVQKFAKTLLVPFAERVPFSDMLSFLNAARWNFGLGGWAVGRDTALFRLPLRGGDTVGFGNLICYESVYPGYVAGLVRRGARFLTVITNDSWWGNTAGPYQHRQFAVLRAIENRRWIIQCANGGISFVVDPSGRILEQTEMFTKTALLAEIGTPETLTPYSRHGDWFAEACFVVTLFILFATGIHRMFRKNMERS
ncbi:MAG TPA: apolipoprotein N-acyltransferase, partial [Bacteroidota bacterium]|nr:apolipoprotein N-acyltransferase [Bacteroidota bacterium]